MSLEHFLAERLLIQIYNLKLCSECKCNNSIAAMSSCFKNTSMQMFNWSSSCWLSSEERFGVIFMHGEAKAI